MGGLPGLRAVRRRGLARRRAGRVRLPPRLPAADRPRLLDVRTTASRASVRPVGVPRRRPSEGQHHVVHHGRQQLLVDVGSLQQPAPPSSPTRVSTERAGGLIARPRWAPSTEAVDRALSADSGTRWLHRVALPMPDAGTRVTLDVHGSADRAAMRTKERAARMSRGGTRLPGRRLEFAGIAASAATVEERAGEVLHQLGRTLPFDAGWLAVRDPEQHRHVPLARSHSAWPRRRWPTPCDEAWSPCGPATSRRPQCARCAAGRVSPRG